MDKLIIEDEEAVAIKLFERLLQTDWLTFRQRLVFRQEIVWRKARLVRVSMATKSDGAKPSK